jgi:hypothetical protein
LHDVFWKTGMKKLKEEDGLESPIIVNMDNNRRIFVVHQETESRV